MNDLYARLAKAFEHIEQTWRAHDDFRHPGEIEVCGKIVKWGRFDGAWSIVVDTGSGGFTPIAAAARHIRVETALRIDALGIAIDTSRDAFTERLAQAVAELEEYVMCLHTDDAENQETEG